MILDQLNCTEMEVFCFEITETFGLVREGSAPSRSPAVF